jgi:hypothetical protein
MSRTKLKNPHLDSSAIDNILASEEKLIPSSGFLASVMDRVHDEARMPAPIHFPWKRAVPGIVLASGVFGWGAFEFVRHAPPAVQALTLTLPHFSAAVELPLEQAGWVALALVVSLVSWLLSRRLVGQSGLL